MKEIINKIQNLYQRLDKFLIFAILVVLAVITFIFNFMWAMPKTFTFLLGLLVGKLLFGTTFVDDALYEESTANVDRSEYPRKTYPSKEPEQGRIKRNDYGQPIMRDILNSD